MTLLVAASLFMGQTVEIRWPHDPRSVDQLQFKVPASEEWNIFGGPYEIDRETNELVATLSPKTKTKFPLVYFRVERNWKAPINETNTDTTGPAIGNPAPDASGGRNTSLGCEP